MARNTLWTQVISSKSWLFCQGVHALKRKTSSQSLGNGSIPTQVILIPFLQSKVGRHLARCELQNAGLVGGKPIQIPSILWSWLVVGAGACQKQETGSDWGQITQEGTQWSSICPLATKDRLGQRRALCGSWFLWKQVSVETKPLWLLAWVWQLPALLKWHEGMCSAFMSGVWSAVN